MAELRRLTDEGTERFRAYLGDLRAGQQAPAPAELLTGPETSLLLSARVEVDRDVFTTRLEAAKYLASVLTRLDRHEIDHNPGLWNWLWLFYFDQLSPATRNGAARPGRDYRYILPPVGDSEHLRHYYRHLLAGAYTVYRLHPGKARVLLCGAVDKFDDFNEQLASRQELVSNPGIVEAADLLYLYAAEGRPERGVAPNRRRLGTLRRFVDVIHQFDVTYDLYSRTGRQIVQLLSYKFARWAER
jgi:hypothetical protein